MSHILNAGYRSLGRMVVLFFAAFGVGMTVWYVAPHAIPVIEEVIAWTVANVGV